MTSLMTLYQHKNEKLRHNRYFEECSTMGKLINRIPGSRLLISSLHSPSILYLQTCLEFDPRVIYWYVTMVFS